MIHDLNMLLHSFRLVVNFEIGFHYICTYYCIHWYSKYWCSPSALPQDWSSLSTHSSLLSTDSAILKAALHTDQKCGLHSTVKSTWLENPSEIKDFHISSFLPSRVIRLHGAYRLFEMGKYRHWLGIGNPAACIPTTYLWTMGPVADFFRALEGNL